MTERLSQILWTSVKQNDWETFLVFIEFMETAETGRLSQFLLNTVKRQKLGDFLGFY